MSHIKEYQRPMVGAKGCSYPRLGNIYGGAQATQEYVVPKICANGPGPHYPPRYDALSHGLQHSCGTYFDMKGAYPYADCTSCKTEYTTRSCGGKIACNSSGKKESYKYIYKYK